RDPAALGVLEGLALACEDAGVGVQLVPAGPGKENLDAVHRAGVDGFVVYSVPDDDPHLQAVLQRPVPTVIIDQPVVPDVDRVGPEDKAASASLSEHRTVLGLRDIGARCRRLTRERPNGFVPRERQENANYHVQRARLAALADAFEAVGVDWSTV